MIIITWLFKAILPENKFLIIILSPLLKYSMWFRIHSLELRAQLCIFSIHLLSLGGYSEDRFESSPYICCLYSHLQIIMIFLTFEWQCIWVWVCKCHSPCMDITGQLQELVHSNLSEVGSLVCHCVHQVHWHELPGDYRQVLQRLAFQGLQTLKHRSLGLHSQSFITELSWQPTDYFISTNSSLVISYMEILSLKDACHGCECSGDCSGRTVGLPHTKIQPHWSCSTLLPSEETLHMNSVPMQRPFCVSSLPWFSMGRKGWFVNFGAKRLQGFLCSSV